MQLEKRLPVASGIGGGSADAAAALRGLAGLWQLSLSQQEILAIAASLGSDVPMCVSSTTAWVEGRGERIMPFRVPSEFGILLVNPLIAVPTRDVFSQLTTRSGTALRRPEHAIASTRSLVQFLEGTSNDLESVAIAIAPQIGEALATLRRIDGVLIARMSGSGATCFAIFETFERASDAFDLLRQIRPDWWIASTRLAQPGSADPRVG